MAVWTETHTATKMNGEHRRINKNYQVRES